MRLGKYVDLNVPDDVVGIKSLRKIHKEGPKRHQLGIILEGNEQFKSHGLWYDILLNEKKVGDMTCGIWSNRMEKNIGLEGKQCPDGFSYNSGNNSHFLEIEELRTLIKDNVGI